MPQVAPVGNNLRGKPFAEKLFILTVQLFAAAGRWIASNKSPRAVVCLIFGVLIAGGLVPGLWFATTENAIDELYIQRGSRLESEYDSFVQYFGGLSRTEATIHLSETGNTANQDTLRSILDTLSPLYKEDETDKCGELDGVIDALPSECSTSPYNTDSIYCTCSQIAASPNQVSVDVAGTNVTVTLTEKDMCERPPVPTVFESHDAVPASAPKSVNTSLYQGVLLQSLAAYEAQYNISSDPVYLATKESAIETCQTTIMGLEQASDRSDLVGNGLQCAGALTVQFGVVYALSVNPGLDPTALAAMWGILAQDPDNTVVAAQTYNTVCSCADAGLALTAVGLTQESVLASATTIATSVGNAFSNQQYKWAADGQYMSYAYGEVAQCIAEYEFINKINMTEGIFDIVIAEIPFSYSYYDDAFYAARDVAIDLIQQGYHPAYNSTSQYAVYAAYVSNAGFLFDNIFIPAWVDVRGAADFNIAATREARELAIEIIVSGQDVLNDTNIDAIAEAYDNIGPVSHLLAVRQTIPQAMAEVSLAAQNATSGIIIAAATSLQAPALLMPNSASVNGTMRPLPIGWGFDRFPCSRSTPLDFFKEGDFDYPYNMKMLDRISQYVYYFFNTDFFSSHVTTADCISKAMSEPLQSALYLNSFADPSIYQSSNFDAFDAAESTFVSTLASTGNQTVAGGAAVQAYILAGGTYINQSIVTSPIVLNSLEGATFMATDEGDEFLSSLATAIGTAAIGSSTLESQFMTTVETFFGFGFWWRPSFGAHITSTANLTTEEIVAMYEAGVESAQNQNITAPMCLVGNQDLQYFLGVPVPTCFLTWSATKQPYELAIGDLVYDTTTNELQSVGAMRTGYLNYNENHPQFEQRINQLLNKETTGPERLEIALKFEQALIDDISPRFEQSVGSGFGDGETNDGETVYFTFERSIEDVVEDAGDLPVGLIVGGYVAMALYVMMTMVHVRSSIYSHTLLGLGGVVTVGFSTAAALGASAFMGVKFTPISTNVIPFIALGIGVDDMLVMAHTYIREVRKGKTAKGVIGKTLGKAGPSITFTSLANFLAFLIGSATPVTVVRLFCRQMVVGIICNYVMIFAIFVPLMVWDCRRTLAGRSEFCITCCHDPEIEEETPKVETACKETIGPDLMRMVSRIIILIVFFGFFGAMIYTGFFVNDTGIRISEVASSSSYQNKFASELEEKFTMFSGSLITISDDIESAQQTILNAAASLATSDYVTKTQQISELYWLHRFLASANNDGSVTPLVNNTFYPAFAEWIGTSGATLLPDLYCIDDTTNENVDCSDIVGAFDSPPTAGSNANVKIKASKGTFYIQNQETTEDFTNAIEDTRAKVDPIVDAYKAANPSDADFQTYPFSYVHLFWEQYLYTESDLYLIVGLCLVGVFVATFLFQFSFVTSTIICFIILMTDIEIYGLMPALGINVNAFSVVNLCVTIGLSVEFTAHIAHQYLAEKGTRSERAQGALTFMGIPVLHGAVTSLIALLFIAGSDVDFIRDYYFSMFFLMVVVASFNGLLLMPVLLSFVGAGATYSLGAYMGDDEEPPRDPEKGVEMAIVEDGDEDLPPKPKEAFVAPPEEDNDDGNKDADTAEATQEFGFE